MMLDLENFRMIVNNYIFYNFC